MRSPTPPTGPAGAGITNTAPRPATTPATEPGSHDQRSTTAVLVRKLSARLIPSATRHRRSILGLPAAATVTGRCRPCLDPCVRTFARCVNAALYHAQSLVAHAQELI